MTKYTTGKIVFYSTETESHKMQNNAGTFCNVLTSCIKCHFSSTFWVWIIICKRHNNIMQNVLPQTQIHHADVSQAFHLDEKYRHVFISQDLTRAILISAGFVILTTCRADRNRISNMNFEQIWLLERLCPPRLVIIIGLMFWMLLTYIENFCSIVD